jgi:hypothetical protein
LTQTDKYRQLAHQYAPIFAQKVSREWIVADQIAPIDFAGSFSDVEKNPEKLYSLADNALIPAKIYYSVCETTTHYFLIYAVYHVLDWWKRYDPHVLDFYNSIRDRYDEHIHDMEGTLLVVTKEPARLVDGVVTVAHGNFYLYTEPRMPTDVGTSRPAFRQSLRVVKFNENVDGNIWLDHGTQRVKLYIESRGHGIHGDHKNWGGGEEIWYYAPKVDRTTPGTLDLNEQRNTRTVTYELAEIFAADGLWAYRFDDRVLRQNQDGRWGLVYRDKKTNRLYGGAANPPWAWNDHNDISPIGEIATDPARFIIHYAQGWGPVSTHYLYNPYQSIDLRPGVD